MSTAPCRSLGPLATMMLGAFAGGMGWGIRGQYGHETGAMIAGLLLSLAETLECRVGEGGVHRADQLRLIAIGDPQQSR